eukprot:7383442-Prymnesium_polylepis.3
MRPLAPRPTSRCIVAQTLVLRSHQRLRPVIFRPSPPAPRRRLVAGAGVSLVARAGGGCRYGGASSHAASTASLVTGNGSVLSTSSVSGSRRRMLAEVAGCACSTACAAVASSACGLADPDLNNGTDRTWLVTLGSVRRACASTAAIAAGPPVSEGAVELRGVQQLRPFLKFPAECALVEPHVFGARVCCERLDLRQTEHRQVVLEHLFFSCGTWASERGILYDPPGSLGRGRPCCADGKSNQLVAVPNQPGSVVRYPRAAAWVIGSPQLLWSPVVV